MAESEKSWTLGRVAAELGGELHGPEDQPVSRPVPADSGDPAGITFATSPKFLQKAVLSGVGAVLISKELVPCPIPHIIVPDARSGFGRLLSLWKRPLPLNPGIHPAAIVDPLATVDPSAQIGAYAVVERGAKVGANAKVYPFAYIGEDCELSEGCCVYPQAVLYQSVCLGPRTIVHAGAVLGADGFGFDWNGTEQVKVPQIGRVETGADVEIGANACVDRATAGTTSLGDDVKLDNLVQIAHNVEIGDHTVIAAGGGIGGSTQIGERVRVGGSVAMADHLQIGDDVTFYGRSSVTSDVEEPGVYWGMPVRPIEQAMRAHLLVYKLPEMAARIRQLEARIKELEEK